MRTKERGGGPKIRKKQGELLENILQNLRNKWPPHPIHVQGGWGGWPTGNGTKVSNSQACCLAQLCLAAAYFFPFPVGHPPHISIKRIFLCWRNRTLRICDVHNYFYNKHCVVYYDIQCSIVTLVDYVISTYKLTQVETTEDSDMKPSDKREMDCPFSLITLQGLSDIVTTSGHRQIIVTGQ